MKHASILLAAAFATSASVAVAQSRDWSAVATPAATGSFVLGNPAARVKLVEYLSYTCPHCAHFARDSDPVLKARMIKSGAVSIEFRNVIANKFDLAAVMLARCANPATFVKFHDAVLARQEEWLGKAAAWDKANAARLAAVPMPQQLRAIADGAGLTVMARTAGLNDAAATRCLGDRAILERAVKVSQTMPPEAHGTPAFLLNGKHVDGHDWAALEPMLRAAGAK